LRTLRGRNSRPHKKKSSVPRASDFSMSRENPAISCSSSPSVATGEPRKSPLQVLHEELLPLPSTDGALQLRNRWFAPARVKGLSAVADERCRTDKLDGVIKRRLSRETTMVGRGASLDGCLFFGGTDGSNPVPSSGESTSRAILPSHDEKPAVRAGVRARQVQRGQQRRVSRGAWRRPAGISLSGQIAVPRRRCGGGLINLDRAQAKPSTDRCSCQASGRRECASSLSTVKSRG